MRTKQVRPEKLKYEIELHINKAYDTFKKQNLILFDFRTVKVFENFIYSLNVIENVNLKDKELEFTIEGLSAPTVALSQYGQARHFYRMYEFKNSEYNLNFMKRGLGKNKFQLKITKSQIKLTRIPVKKFIDIKIDNKKIIYVS